MASERIVNIYDAKTHLSKLLVEVAEGAEITIARAGEPIAKIVPVQPRGRELGSARGLVVIPDAFDITDEDIVDDFYR